MVEDFHNALFALGEPFKYGKHLVPVIDKLIDGRCLGAGWDMGLLAQVVHDAGHGDYIEIGSAFGGSLIVAGRTKRKYGLGGRLVSIDPYSSDYPWISMHENGHYISPELLQRNIGKAKLEFTHYCEGAEHFDWAGLKDPAVIYVDGDHDGDAPHRDISLAMTANPKFIVVDNYEVRYPLLIEAVITAGLQGYRLVHVSGITAVLARLE